MCQEHPNFALTSKLPYGSLNETTGEFIAQLKHESREQIKQEILKEILHEKNEKNGLNETIYENCNEIEALRVENNLLKELYKETVEKNELLNELLTKERQLNNGLKIVQYPMSYAEVITTKKQTQN